MYYPDINWEHLQKKIHLDGFDHNFLIKKNWVLALSGGADSVLSLIYLITLAEHSPIKPQSISLYYLNHMDQSNIEESKRNDTINFYLDYVKRKIPDLNIHTFFYKRPLKNILEHKGLNFEYYSSRIRWKHLRIISEKLGNTVIVTGHSMTDWIETLLLRINRGTDFEKILPFGPYEKDFLFEHFYPLSRLARESVRFTLSEFNLPFWDDPSNLNGNKRALLRNYNLINNEKGALITLNNLLKQKNLIETQKNKILLKILPDLLEVSRNREYRIEKSIFNKLDQNSKDILLEYILKKLSVWPVSSLWRNKISEGKFHGKYLNADTENWNQVIYIVFHRGRNNLFLSKNKIEKHICGSEITKSYYIELQYGKKSITKIFSENKLSKRQRQNIFLKRNPNNKMEIDFIPLSVFGLKDYESSLENLRKS